MSSHDFDRRYRLLTRVAEGGGVRSHHAQELATGRVVMVHVADDAGPEVVARMQGRLERLPPPEQARVLETATLPAGFVVVTTVLPGLTTFPDWLLERVEPAPLRDEPAPRADLNGGDVPVPNARAVPPRPADGLPPFDGPPVAMEFRVGGPPPTGPDALAPPGEFTRLFMAGGRVHVDRSEPGTLVPPPGTAPAVPPPSPVMPPAAPVAASSAAPAAPPLVPGEFTRMFQPAGAAPAGRPTASPLVAPSAVPAVPAVPAAPAAFAPLAVPASATPEPAESATGVIAVRSDGPPLPAGALAAFASPSDSSGAPAPEVAAVPAAMPAAPPPRNLAPPFAAPPPVASAPLGSSPAGLTPASPFAGPPFAAPPFAAPPFAGPSVAQPTAGLGSPSPFAAPTPAGAAGPSEYTRLIRQTATPPVPLPAAPSAPAAAFGPPASRPPIPFALVAVVNLVVLLALALVLYFVFRTPPVPAAPPPAAPPPPTAAAPNA